MKAEFSDDQLKTVTVFMGNVNGAICEIMKIENHVTSYRVDLKREAIPSTKSPVSVVIIKDRKKGHTFQYGLEALKRCDIEIC